jgi:hypothetical protein
MPRTSDFYDEVERRREAQRRYDNQTAVRRDFDRLREAARAASADEEEVECEVEEETTGPAATWPIEVVVDPSLPEGVQWELRSPEQNPIFRGVREPRRTRPLARGDRSVAHPLPRRPCGAATPEGWPFVGACRRQRGHNGDHICRDDEGHDREAAARWTEEDIHWYSVTPAAHGQPQCARPAPGTMGGWFCTRPREHAGPHVAHSLFRNDPHIRVVWLRDRSVDGWPLIILYRGTDRAIQPFNPDRRSTSAAPLGYQHNPHIAEPRVNVDGTTYTYRITTVEDPVVEPPRSEIDTELIQ